MYAWYRFSLPDFSNVSKFKFACSAVVFFFDGTFSFFFWILFRVYLHFLDFFPMSFFWLLSLFFYLFFNVIPFFTFFRSFSFFVHLHSTFFHVFPFVFTFCSTLFNVFSFFPMFVHFLSIIFTIFFQFVSLFFKFFKFFCLIFFTFLLYGNNISVNLYHEIKMGARIFYFSGELVFFFILQHQGYQYRKIRHASVQYGTVS